MIIKDIQEEIIDEFELFDDWMQRYEYIIESGKSLPEIDEKYKSEDALIKGCQSKVWLHGDYKDGKLYFTADSDAILTKGIVALLLRLHLIRSLAGLCFFMFLCPLSQVTVHGRFGALN